MADSPTETAPDTATVRPGRRFSAGVRAAAGTSPLSAAAEAVRIALAELAVPDTAVRCTAVDVLRPFGRGRADARPGTLTVDGVVTAVAASPPGGIVEAVLTVVEDAAAAQRPPAATRPEADAADPQRAGEMRISITAGIGLPPADPADCPGSRRWGRLLQARLDGDPRTAELLASYDGTMGIRIGGRELHIRCYRGQVLEIVPRSLLGADFIVDIPGDEFIALMTHDRYSFMESAMRRRLGSSGSGYEYLRMTSALVHIIELARTMAVEAGWGVPFAPGAARSGEPA
ncbi:hypothetical protein [Brevibacterium sp.]|uniref:hypothetical protein n=1 Tax=Brevibacterium sp. TaxID=1701 RepID=UPI0025BAA3CB|nr:hypothetical protein [Brevibacterium sp.]